MQNSLSALGATRCSSTASISGQRRRASSQRRDELARPRPFDLQQNALGVVAHEAPEIERTRETVHEGTKAHALHRAAHPHAQTFRCFAAGTRGLHDHYSATAADALARAQRAARASIQA